MRAYTDKGLSSSALPSNSQSDRSINHHTRPETRSSDYERGRRYVRENHDDLATILRHGTSIDVRSYAFAVLNRYSNERDIEEIKRELDKLQEVRF